MGGASVQRFPCASLTRSLVRAGIGVPILLAYIYGVVPVSLCRSGGCGVTTSASGVRIEFDEEAEGAGVGGGGAGGGSLAGGTADGASLDTAGGGAPASIGEAASLGMSGGSPSLASHLDAAAAASNTALAGHSLTGSIASASAHSHR